MNLDGAYVALKGYCFQFDKTILEIFKNSSKQIAVEQIQDLGFDDYIIQVKHHDTSYTESQRRAKLKKPILQLLSEFKIDNSKQYVLYIYFKDIAASISKLDTGLLDAILGADSSEYDIATKNGFIVNFTLVYAEDFEKLHSNVITVIKNAYGKNKDEAELYYSIISSHLLNLIIKYSPSDKHKRISDKREIDELILNSKRIVFKSAYSQILAEEKYYKLLKRQFFNTTLNTYPFERFFIIEVPSSFQIHTLKEIVLTIKAKWSRNKSKTIPDNDRVAPYIYFRGILELSLISLKQGLQADGLRVKDGHDFYGASFYIEDVMERPTFYNQIHFRFLNTPEILEQVLTKVTKTKEVYQFFLTDPIDLNFDGKHIKVEIKDIADIKSII